VQRLAGPFMPALGSCQCGTVDPPVAPTIAPKQSAPRALTAIVPQGNPVPNRRVATTVTPALATVPRAPARAKAIQWPIVDIALSQPFRCSLRSADVYRILTSRGKSRPRPNLLRARFPMLQHSPHRRIKNVRQRRWGSVGTYFPDGEFHESA
jgi:hypothetical protein